MSDLPYIQQAQEVKITGQSSSGGTSNFVGADASGNMLTKDVADGTVGAAVTSIILQTGGKDTSGNLRAFLTDTNGNQIVLLKDANGNNINADNGQILSQDTLATGGQNRAQSVTTTAAEALGAATILANRKVLTIIPTNGIVYWGFTSGVTTASGSPIASGQPFSISATDNVHIFVISAGTVDCRISEGS